MVLSVAQLEEAPMSSRSLSLELFNQLLFIRTGHPTGAISLVLPVQWVACCYDRKQYSCEYRVVPWLSRDGLTETGVYRGS